MSSEEREDMVKLTVVMPCYNEGTRIYKNLIEMGFTVLKPSGTFYILPKALEEDSIAFCNKAKEYDLIFVPADNFGAPGFFRMAYCIDTDKVERAMIRLRQFVEEVYGKEI